MFKLVIAVLALAALGVNGRPYAEESEVFECNGKPNGYYADDSDKRAFFSCFEGSLVSRVLCEEGFEFDGVETCVPAAREEEDTTVGVVEDEKDQNQDEGKTGNDDDDDDDDDDDGPEGRVTKKKIFNIEITKNVFPKSLVIIGKMNREQKNK